MATGDSGTLWPDRNRESSPRAAETPERAGSTQSLHSQTPPLQGCDPDTGRCPQKRWAILRQLQDHDISCPLAQATSKKNGFHPLKKQLRQAGVKYGTLYPAILRVDTQSGGTKSFDSAEAASSFLQREYPEVISSRWTGHTRYLRRRRTEPNNTQDYYWF